MDSLRLILLLAGVALIAGIYAFETLRRRRAAGARRAAGTEPEVGGIESLGADDAEPAWLGRLDDVDPSLAGEEGLRLGDLGAVEQVTAARAPAASSAPPRAAPARPPRAGTGRKPAPAATRDELVVAITVMVRGGGRVEGPALLDALAAVGMHHGEMDIFHHPGVGRDAGERPVFSAANVLEPGTFDLATADTLSTPGVVLFMRLPGPLDASVAFELMLSTAQRLADLIGGELRDQSRSSLTPQAIGHLRERAAEFARRQLLPGG